MSQNQFLRYKKFLKRSYKKQLAIAGVPNYKPQVVYSNKLP